MHVVDTYDARLFAWSKANAAKDGATTDYDRNMAEAIANLAYSVEQLNKKLDLVLVTQAKLLQR